ncbi:hypothetical protein CRG98_043494 [Punica granatum]|uniref:Uncharacterized protein n=1 Tax=Punica granatum TaxID=22663 RepID=A0A2I0HWP6_PUNGR|nr:hypothetical protein CRG98_043494 [Punica granatum]
MKKPCGQLGWRLLSNEIPHRRGRKRLQRPPMNSPLEMVAGEGAPCKLFPSNPSPSKGEEIEDGDARMGAPRRLLAPSDRLSKASEISGDLFDRGLLWWGRSSGGKPHPSFPFP